MRQSRRIPVKIKPKYAIVVEGETEFWYIQMLKRNQRLVNIDLKPEIPQRKTLQDQYEKAIELSKDYDKVYWIIDFDIINKESRERKRGAKTTLQDLKAYCDNIERNFKNIIIVIINNPCFEYWLLLHFEATSKFYYSYDELFKQLRKYLPDYDKSQIYYTKQNNDIYLRLASKLPNAIANANRLTGFDFDNPNRGVSQMHLLFKDIDSCI
jgi:hypothetical protein